jgi:hypothetical protein
MRDLLDRRCGGKGSVRWVSDPPKGIEKVRKISPYLLLLQLSFPLKEWGAERRRGSDLVQTRKVKTNVPTLISAW